MGYVFEILVALALGPAWAGEGERYAGRVEILELETREACASTLTGEQRGGLASLAESHGQEISSALAVRIRQVHSYLRAPYAGAFREARQRLSDATTEARETLDQAASELDRMRLRRGRGPASVEPGDELEAQREKVRSAYAEWTLLRNQEQSAPSDEKLLPDDIRARADERLEQAKTDYHELATLARKVDLLEGKIRGCARSASLVEGSVVDAQWKRRTHDAEAPEQAKSAADQPTQFKLDAVGAK